MANESVTKLPSSGQVDTATNDKYAKMLTLALDQAYRSAGGGSYTSQYQTILSKFDKFGRNYILPNHENTGLTFITRPKLNLTTSSIRQDPVLCALDTVEPLSLNFSIRTLLDTKLAKSKKYSPIVAKCPFIDDTSPFLIPLSNCLIGFTGTPDYFLETQTTEGGYYSEDITFAKGSDRNARTYDLNLTFREIHGGYIMALLYLWMKYIDCVTRGECIAYTEDILANRINYTCSIYRLTLDPSRRSIPHWAKYTGCFPKSVPIGSIFNFGPREPTITSMAEYTVPFVCNHVQFMDGRIFQDFNYLTERFNSDITANMKDYVSVPNIPDYNFIGTPYIDTVSGTNEIRYLANKQTLKNITDSFQSDWAGVINGLENPGRVDLSPYNKLMLGLPNIPSDPTSSIDSNNNTGANTTAGGLVTAANPFDI